MNKQLIIIVVCATLFSGFVGGYVGGLVGGNNQSVSLGGITNLDALELNDGLMVTGSSTLSKTLTTTSTTTIKSVTERGNTLSTTTGTGTVVPLSEADLLNYRFVLLTPGTVGDTNFFTVPASSTLTTFLPNAGDSSELVVQNSTTTAGAFLAFRPGAGVVRIAATTTATTTIGGAIKIRFVRVPTGTGTAGDILANYVIGFKP